MSADECCCECSPPEFGGSLPDRDCPIHGDDVAHAEPLCLPMPVGAR